jgi:5-methylthioadenosine/S-adenosylhomocysteine deaminase
MKSTPNALVIKGGRIYDHDGNVHDPAIGDIVVMDGVIKAVGPGLADRIAAGQSVAGVSGEAIGETLDASGKLVLPGFVNAHYHSHDVLLKGSFETIPLEFWVLNALPPSYPKRSSEEIRARTLLGALECLRSGMTSVQDMVTLSPFDPHDVDVIQDAYEEAGIRAVLALQVADVPGLKSIPFWEELIPDDMKAAVAGAAEPFGPDVDMFALMEETIRAKRGAKALVHWALGPSSPERCSEPFLVRLADLSKREALPVYSHLYESKAMTLIARQRFDRDQGSLIRYMQRVGLLGPRLSLAHSVWLLPDEIRILAETGTNVVLNPVGNLKTRSGVAPIRELIDEGVVVALGSDNCSCSDVQNMFQAMKLYCSLAAVTTPEPGPPYAADALRAATLNGAATAGLGDRLGALKPGMIADLSVLDLSDPSYVPLNSVARQTVFAETGRSVQTVVVNGEVVLRDGRPTRFDEQALREEVEGLMTVVRADREEVVARTKRMESHLLKANKMIWDSDVGTNRYVAGTAHR